MRRFSLSAWVWILLGGAYFFIPLLATFLFSIKDKRTGQLLQPRERYGTIIRPQFWTTFKLSILLALETIAISLVLFVPTIYWVHLKLPRLRPVLSVHGARPVRRAADHPRRRPARVLQGHAPAPFWYHGNPYWLPRRRLCDPRLPVRVLLTLDAGFRAIDVHTLTEASLNLGASWPTTLFRVILPNIRAAALSAAFLTLAIVMGEFTIASLSAFHTFPTYIQYINETKGFRPLR